MAYRIGITGNRGFIGRHLTNYLNLDDTIEIIPFERNFFKNESLLEEFVTQCNVIVHLAAVCRHPDEQVLFDTNFSLDTSLINACEKTNSKPHILFSSSTHEERDTAYGKSKKEGNRLFSNWAKKTGAKFTALISPGVFGPFGKPNFNSVVATFCHKLTHGEMPEIIQDGEVALIYVNELIEVIKSFILSEEVGQKKIAPRHKIKVSELLTKLTSYKTLYIENGEFPPLDTPLDLALFNTFRCYVPKEHYPVLFTKHTDPRGAFVEIVRAGSSGQFSYSTTVPGITRGNHFHTRKAERFSVIKGKARICLRKIDSDETIEYILNGEKPAFVDIPIWYTHNITNIGEDELVTLFWINEPYNSEDPDTWFVNV